MARISCIVVTPEATAVEAEADFVAVPLFDGEKGIGRDHAPLIGRLGYGELRLRQGNQTSRYYVDGGFVQVQNNVVSIMTGRAVPAKALDRQVIDKQLSDAQRQKAHSAASLETRDRVVAQARAQLRVASKN